jgi:hypothetical protein
MSKNTDLTAFLGSGNLPTISEADIAATLNEVVEEQGTSGGGVDYMSFSGKTGRYALGRDKEDVDAETPYIMEPQSIVEGYTCWKGQRPVDRVEWSVFDRAERAIAKDNLTDHGPYRESAGEGWKKMLGFGVTELTQSDSRQNIKFACNSPSGNNAISDLFGKIAERVSAGEPHIPLVCFDSETFEAQEQKNYKPKLNIEVWQSREAVTAFLDGSMSEEDLLNGKKPKAKRVRK